MKFSITIPLLLAQLLAQTASADSTPATFAYVLQADALAKTKPAAVIQIANSGRDWIVLDAVFGDDVPWARADIEAIRHGQQRRKVLAYISIGEAEDYRPYWQKKWRQKGSLTAAAPVWLGAENQKWKGNYRVKYWHAEWQKRMLAAIDDIMAHGFDGVYLDIVDGFEMFERVGKKYMSDRVNPETKQSYRRDMVDWVKTIAARVRTKNSAALVIPQNGSQLLAHEDFLDIISAIGIEDLFTNDDMLQHKSNTNEVLNYLKKMSAKNKPVLLIEYPKTSALQALSKKLAHENGLIWLVTNRQLTTLGVSGS